MSAPVFVPMQEADLDWVAAREREIYAFPWSLNNFRDALSAGYSCWLMRDGADAMGYGIVMRVLDEAHLLNISVIPERQKQGHGEKLLAFLKELAQQHGGSQMFLEVRASNLLAAGFYLRRGFSQIGLRKAYYPAAAGREDALIMRCAL
ncbi:MAG: ribosomal-protein-alanine N-acetyltransferase [Pseudomonadota bacterium]